MSLLPIVHSHWHNREKPNCKEKRITPKNGRRIEECVTLDIFFMDDPLWTFLSRMFLNRRTIAKRYFCEQFLQKEQQRKRNLSSPGESDMIFMCVNSEWANKKISGVLSAYCVWLRTPQPTLSSFCRLLFP